MELSYEREYQLRTADFDRYERMQPFAVMDIFQEVATLQADRMGIGAKDMFAKGVFWAVVRMRYEVVRQPRLHERVVARSWPHTPSRFSFMRDYSMRTPEGEPLIMSTSEWVLVDLETRSFAPFTDYYDGPTELLEDRALGGMKLKKLPDFTPEGNDPYIQTCTFSDLDFNGHVNNARYANYLMNALRPGEGYELSAVQMDFRHELHEGDQVAVHLLREEGLVRAKVVDASGATMFSARLEVSST